MPAANQTKADHMIYMVAYDVIDAARYVFSDIMRGHEARVVSAWKYLPTMSPELLADPEARRQACFELWGAVETDIARSSVGVESDGFTDWVYGPFIHLYAHYGEEWPLEALTACMQAFPNIQPEQWAQQEWLRAVEGYELLKSSRSRNRPNR